MENTEEVTQRWQSRETGNTGNTRQKKNPTQCALDSNTNNVNKTWALLQTTGGKGRTDHRLYAEITTRNPKRKDT